MGIAKINDMLKTEIYLKTANEFGVSVGVAHSIKFSPLEDSLDIVEKPTYKRMSSDLAINKMVIRCIELGEYYELQRELYRIRLSKGKRKISELSIYKEAVRNLNSLRKSTKQNGSKTDTKPKQIYSYR
jgi:hypothetical protein